MNFEKVLEKHGLEFPNPPGIGGVYTPAREFGKGFYYLSGCLPRFNGETIQRPDVVKDKLLKSFPNNLSSSRKYLICL